MNAESPATAPSRPRDIAVFGLGYVGSVCAACLTELGHRVVGVDIAPEKVELANAGVSPVLEPGLSEIMQRAVATGRLRATGNPREAVTQTEIALICVGTPSLPNGAQNQEAIQRVAAEIGASLAERRGYYGIVVRSTVLPGTSEEVVARSVERASGRSGPDAFGVASNPEFLREGSALQDFFHPPYTLVGASDPRIVELLRDVYAGLGAPFLVTDPRLAEMLKFVNNAYHALKIVFANEVGTICKALGIDSHELMQLFVRDRKLNISDKYLRPGFAFGGSCLPKDTRALAYVAKSHDLELPVLGAVLRSNELHVRRAVQLVESFGRRRIGVLGLTFKPGTDDLRESPVVELVETLLGRGYDVRVYDPSIDLSRLTGANKRFIDREIPHLSKLMVQSTDEVVANSDVIILGYDAPEFRPALHSLNGARCVVDLAGVPAGKACSGYTGLAW